MEDSTKNHYGDDELQEFREVINQKLAIAREELQNLISALQSENENGTDDTGSTYKTLEDGSSTLHKESTSQLASRLKKFIQNFWLFKLFVKLSYLN